MRPTRNRDPKIYRLITIRTMEARLWIGLSSNVRKTLGGILARYQELLEIKLYSYCILGNHMHLLARAPKKNIDEFCENVNREIARRMNWRNKRQGKFWGRRYDDQKVLTEDDLKTAFLYINTNPTRHGLVANSRDWPGLISYQQAIDGQDRGFSFYHYSKEGKVTRHKLKLSVLPHFQGLNRKNRIETITELLRERTASLVKERDKPFLGLEALLDQEIGEMPTKVSKSRRPSCYTKDSELRREFRRRDRIRREEYTQASIRYRLGLDADFPEYSFKPPLHRAPRLIPFKPLTVEHFKNVA